MPIKTLTVYPQIISVVVDVDVVVSIQQEYNQNPAEIEKAVQECVQTVKKYDKMGYYNLAKPEFVSDVISTFSNLELSKKNVIRVNDYLKIIGFPECNRVWQLPDEMKVQISQMLEGYRLSYDENWQSLKVEKILQTQK